MAKKPKDNDWKDRLNVVYSTNPDFNYEVDDDEEQTTLPQKQRRRGRKCQNRRNHRTGRFQTKSAGATAKGGIYTDKACGLSSSPSGEDYKKSGRHGHFHATAFVYFYSYRIIQRVK